MFKKMLSILLTFAMLLSMIPVGYAEDLEVVEESAEEDILIAEEPAEEPEETISEVGAEITGVVASGECGDNLTWTLDDLGTLTISGTGEMSGFGYLSAPWYDYREQITSLVIEDGVTNVHDYAFMDCSNLTSVVLPESVAAIGDMAFESCSSLTSIEIPQSVTEIKSYAFSGCSALSNVEMHEGLLVIGEHAFSSSGLTELRIPETVTTIGAAAFYHCDYLQHTEIPDSVTSLGSSVFAYNYALTSIVFGRGISYVDDYTVGQCYELRTIRFLGAAPSFHERALYDTHAAVFYPANDGSWTTYKQQSYGGNPVWVPYDDGPVAEPLTPGVATTAEFEYGGESVFFSFTPETTDEYIFKSVDSIDDPSVTLYDSNWNVMTSDFGSAGNRNFRISCTLYAGETYYFRVETMQSVIASVPVLLTVYFENNFTAWAERSSVYASYGDSAELVVLVDGNDLSGVSYQWSVLREVTHGEGDDAWTSETYVDIDGATDSRYVTGPVTERGTYRCIASDAYDNRLDVYFSVNLDVHLTAEAVQTYVRVAPGEPATMEVIASSDDPDKITYQWLDYREVTYGEGDNTWTSWEYVDIEGATDSSYTTGPITKAANYYCRVYDGYGNSRDVWFRVMIENHFSAQAVQQDVYVALGETATLEVTATSDDPDQITYEWRVLQKQYNEDGSYWTNWVVIDGATDSSYVTEPVTEHTEYYCYVYDGYGYTESIWFNVNVETHFSAKRVEQELWVGLGETATLEVEASSDDPDKITYEWRIIQKHTYEDGGYWSEEVPIDGATGSSYVTEPITEYTDYTCRVFDGYGNIIDVGWFNVYVDTHFYAEPVEQDLWVGLGETATMEVTASSDDPDKITYQWYRQERHYTTDGYTSSDILIEGATGSSYVTGPITESTGFYCRVSDGYGYSTGVGFNVYLETHFTAQAVQETVYTALGETAALEVTASSDDPDRITYQWLREEKHYNEDGGYWTQWAEIEGATGSSFITDPITERTNYRCQVGDGYGNRRNVWFRVYVDTHFSAEAVQQNVSVSPNETATLEVTASSDDPDKISYQWCILGMRYNENGESWTDWIEIEGATDSSYVTDPITEYTRYYCRVSDGYGSTNGIDFHVRIDTNFTAYAANSEVYVPLNSPAELEVIASSDAPEKITYQWSYEIRHYDEHGGYGSEWVEIEGATGSSFITDPITERMTYLCQVSDGYGYAVGVSVNVYVDTHFNTWTEQSTVTVAPGETATMEVFASSDDPDKITYQWFSLERHYNSDGGYWDEWIAIEGATESSYTTGPVTKRQQYGCRVEDGYGADRWYDFSVTIDYTSQIPMLAQPLTLDTPTDAVIEGDCEFAFFYFIPEESDDYILSSLCENEDSYCHLYNEDLQEIATNDDGGENTNFYLQYYLEAGKTYYYGVRFYDRSSGTIPIVLRRSNHLTARPNGNSDLRLPYGETAELSVIASATDASMITYRWYRLGTVVHTDSSGYSWESREWIPIEGVTGSSYTTPAVTEYVQYRCTVEDGYGGLVNVWFNIRIETYFIARAAERDVKVPFGNTALLEVIAESDVPDKITYQWYRGYKFYYGDNNWGWSYSGDTLLAGETSSTFTTPEINEYQVFVCRVSDGFGSDETIWFYVSVDTGFEAWSEQSSFQVAPDSELTLEAFATSAFPELITYQWYEYDDYNGTYTKLEGETGSTYATGAITAECRLECRVSDGYGTEARLSYHILVETHLSAYAKERQITAPLNGTATLQVVASSDVPEKITYAWEGPGLSGSENGPTISVGPMMYESLYYCHVSDGYGSVVSVSFVVKIDTGFYAYPKENPILVAPGEKVSLEIVAGANDPSKLSFEWNKATWEQFGPTYWDWGEGTLLEEETGPTLTTDAINQRTLYYGPVSDGYNNPIWINFEIIVDSGFQVQLEENIQTVYVPYEQTAQLEVPIVTNYPDKLKIQWYRSELYSYMGNFWPMDENIIEGATETSLTTDPVTKAIGYICVIDDGFGNNAIIYFNVFPQTNLTAKAEQETIYVNAGDSVTARVIASADEPEKISYQWYESRQVERYGELREEWVYLDTATDAAFLLSEVDGYHKLGCMVYDGYGNSVMVTIFVYVQNHFGAEAVNPENYIGLNDRVELKLNVHGDDLTGLSYAWYRWTYIGMGMGYYEYMRIDGADGSSLSVGTEYEAYRCIVTDRYGTPVEVDFAVKIREENPDGYTIILTDYTKGAAQTSLDFGASYSGSVTFTVSAERPVVVAVKKGDSYTALKCTTVDGEHRYTLNVTEDTELVFAFRGDVNLDGTVKSSEVTMIKRAIAKTYNLKNGMAALTADVNGDGSLKSSDATMLARSIAGTYNLKW